MKVAVMGRLSREAGGIMPAVAALCRNLMSDEVSLRVFGVEDAFTQADAPEWGAVPVTPYRGIGPLNWSPELFSMINRQGFDLAHLHGLWMHDQWVSLKWHRRSGKPVVISPHGMLDPWAARHAGWKKKLVGRLFAQESFERAACLHALCTAEAEAIRAFGLTNPIAVIPNGIELPDMPVRQATDGEKRLLFLGRLHPKKGLVELLEGWAKSHPAGWRLQLAGWDDGGHEPLLRHKTETLGLADQVDFLGPQFGADKDRLLRRADAFVLPSFSEGLPMSVLEAWAYRLPVLMTEHCNLPEGFDAGAARRIEPDAESIAQGLKGLAAESEEALLTMGAEGRALVEARYTWPQLAADMREVYAWCLGGDQPACIWDG